MEAQAPRFGPDLQVVQAYRRGGFRIAGTDHGGSVLVFPDRVLSWPVAHPDEITLDRLAAVRRAEPTPDILVIGLGLEFAPLSPELRQAIRTWGPVAEVMATPAACRTYNLLLAEERRVAAALIALPA